MSNAEDWAAAGCGFLMLLMWVALVLIMFGLAFLLFSLAF